MSEVTKEDVKELLFNIQKYYGKEELLEIATWWQNPGYAKFFDMPERMQKRLFVMITTAFYDAKKNGNNPCGELEKMIPF